MANEQDNTAQLLADLELTFNDARGNRKHEVVQVVPVRSLVAEDVPLLDELTPAVAPILASLRSPHHRIAQLLAQGERVTEVAIMTGYSISYVSNLKNDPAFRDLCKYYETQRDQIFADLLDRMKTLGIVATEELLARVTEHPEKWSNRELMELAEMCVPQTDIGRRGQGGAIGPGVAINVSFVSPPGKTIEGKVIDQ